MASQYVPKDVVMILGPIVIDERAEGEFLSIEQNTERHALTMGGDGRGTVTDTSNDSARLTVTLQQSSETNALLSAQHNLHNATGSGFVPLLVRDGSGTSVYTAAHAWIVSAPTASFSSTEAGTRAWIIETDRLIRLDGGN
jgi:hypothetical protein